MTDIQPQAAEIVKQYVHLTGREARVSAYEFDLFNFERAGFSCAEFVCVLKFVLGENKRNRCQYSIQLGHLIRDHAHFMDLLGEAKARQRNAIKPATEKEKTLAQWRGCGPVENGSVHRISEFLKIPKP